MNTGGEVRVAASTGKTKELTGGMENQSMCLSLADTMAELTGKEEPLEKRTEILDPLH